MKKYLIDTNIFLRAILDDDKTQSPKAKAFLKNIKTSPNHYYTTSWVVAEIIWTLQSFYKYSRKEVEKIINALFNTANLEVLEEKLVIEALILFVEKKVDFIDGINYLISRDNEFHGIVSFDEDFDKLNNKRISPQ